MNKNTFYKISSTILSTVIGISVLTTANAKDSIYNNNGTTYVEVHSCTTVTGSNGNTYISYRKVKNGPVITTLANGARCVQGGVYIPNSISNVSAVQAKPKLGPIKFRSIRR